MSKEEEKQSLWTNLNIKIDLDVCLTRRVLFEKYSKKEVMRYFFMKKLNNCELFKQKNYPNSVFYIKNDGGTDGGKNEILFEKYEKNEVFYIKHAGIWEVFETRFGMQYADIQTFTQDILEELLKFQGYKTETVT